MSHTTPVSDGAEPELKYFFVKRPVMAAVISIVITLLGLFALQRLPINRYPQITPPAWLEPLFSALKYVTPVVIAVAIAVREARQRRQRRLRGEQNYA